MAVRHKPGVFTIPASAPFLPTLIKALAEGRLLPGFPDSRDPFALATATMYLPTRRACRLARDLFLPVTGAEAALLPRIVAIGDLDEDDLAFAQAAAGVIGGSALELPPALGGLERRLLLARLVVRWAASPEMRSEAGEPLVAQNPSAALALADDLARVIDDMTTRQVPWEHLDDLVPDELDAYWQLTLKFLKLAREAWPAVLAERGAIEPASRRDHLIAAEAERLAKTDAPVIIAGSTGSIPSTAALIAAIAALPHGAVVLPGLDTDLDEPSWALISGTTDGPGRMGGAPAIGHPQFSMQALLRHIGVSREDVGVLAPPAHHGRELYVSEALRPAAATEHWHDRLTQPSFAAHLEQALTGLSVIEAANAQEEALTIALALREALQTPHMTAALITPDRALARRVIAELARWDVAVDDSGGDALADTPAGLFARLAAETALGGLAPVALLALLKHPLLRMGFDGDELTSGVGALERAVLRGPRPRPGSAGLAQALASLRVELSKLRNKQASDLHPSDPRANLTDRELDLAALVVDRLRAALAPLESLAPALQPFGELAGRHREAIFRLTLAQSGEVAGFAANDGTALAALFEEIALAGAGADLTIQPSDYAELFRGVMSGRVVRRPELRGLRVRIYGPLEARLQSIDRLVLGGLVEGTWPPETRTDPWLSRPMRHALGLDLPERRVSLSAHDFAQALGAREVILTWSSKLAGAPTVASRLLQRLAAVAGERWQTAQRNGEKYLAWARALDQPAEVKPTRCPAPCPPIVVRPLALAVTDIEHWLRDPYTIYARHILKLRELDPVDLPPGAADRGMVIHGAISEFTKAFAAKLPEDPQAALIAIGRKHFTAIEDYPEARAFWWPRFLRIARWYTGWESLRRNGIVRLASEIRGEIAISLGRRTFKLSARADRIEQCGDGRYAIIDYKTGQVPSDKQVRTGISPQLTLEATILRCGGFPGIPAGASIAELVYVALKGGETAGQARAIKFEDQTADAAADCALAKLKELATRFEDEKQAYRPLVSSMWKNRYGAYDHLARVKEWSMSGDLDDPGGEE